jgi:hypothetical protein
VARGLVAQGLQNSSEAKEKLEQVRKSCNTGQYIPIAVRFVTARKSGALGLRARSTAEADIQGADLWGLCQIIDQAD